MRSAFRGLHIGWMAALASALAVACSEPPQARDARQRPLSVGISSAPSTLNDVLSGGETIERELFELLYLSLVEPSADLSAGPQTYAPELAESWSFSNDRRELTFVLRRDARWSDGHPISAADVRFTWEAQTAPETAWAFADLKRHIADVVVVDEWTVRFLFDEVSATQLADANEGVILPRHVWGELPFERWREELAWFADRMVSSGPYRVARWKPAAAPELARNEHYFDPTLPRIDRVELVVVADEGTQLRMLQSRELDFVSQLRPRNVAQVESSPWLRVIDYPRRQINFIAWNTRRPFFRSSRVRRALAHAIDRQSLIDTVLPGQALVASSVVPSSFWAHDSSIQPWPFDLQEAGRLLSEEGWIDRDEDGWLDRDGSTFRFELVTNAGSEVRWEALQVIRENLRRVGIDVTISRLEITTAVSAMQSHEFDAALTAMSPDTTLDLSFTLHSDAIEGQYNFSAYSNPEVDSLIESINRADDSREIAILAGQVQRIVHHDQPMLLLWEPLGLAAATVELENVEPDAVSVLGSLPRWSWRSSSSAVTESLASARPPLLSKSAPPLRCPRSPC